MRNFLRRPCFGLASEGLPLDMHANQLHRFGRGSHVPGGTSPAHADIEKAVAAGMVFMVLCATVFIMQAFVGGRWGFLVATIMSAVFDIMLWYGIVKNDHRSFALKFAFVANFLLKLMPLGACLSLPLNEDHIFPGGTMLFDSPLAAAGGAMIRTSAIAFVLLITRPVSMPLRYDIPIRRMLRQTSPRYEFFLIFAGIVNLSYWVAVTGLDNPVFYFARILNTTLDVVPFFVGLTAFQFKRATIFWLVVLAIQVVIALLTGTRGAAFWPLMYFLCGFIFGMPNWKVAIKWSIGMAPVALALGFLAVWIGAVRSETGRTDLATALKTSTMIEVLSDPIVASGVQIRGNHAFEAFRRLTIWGDYIVPAMTPDPIPYRGFSDFRWEVSSAFNLGIFALVAGASEARSGVYFSSMALKPYGFAVHVDKMGMKTSNVPFPVNVSAFTRGGWLPAIGFTVFAFFMVFTVERIFKKMLLPRRQPLFLFMMMVMCYISYRRIRGDTLVETLRQFALEGTFAFVCFYIFDEGLKRIGKR